MKLMVLIVMMGIMIAGSNGIYLVLLIIVLGYPYLFGIFWGRNGMDSARLCSSSRIPRHNLPRRSGDDGRSAASSSAKQEYTATTRGKKTLYIVYSLYLPILGVSDPGVVQGVLVRHTGSYYSYADVAQWGNNTLL